VGGCCSLGFMFRVLRYLPPTRFYDQFCISESVMEQSGNRRTSFDFGMVIGCAFLLVMSLTEYIGLLDRCSLLMLKFKDVIQSLLKVFWFLTK
jgi:hypothetical protein